MESMIMLGALGALFVFLVVVPLVLWHYGIWPFATSEVVVVAGETVVPAGGPVPPAGTAAPPAGTVAPPAASAGLKSFAKDEMADDGFRGESSLSNKSNIFGFGNKSKVVEKDIGSSHLKPESSLFGFRNSNEADKASTSSHLNQQSRLVGEDKHSMQLNEPHPDNHLKDKCLKSSHLTQNNRANAVDQGDNKNDVCPWPKAKQSEKNKA